MVPPTVKWPALPPVARKATPNAASWARLSGILTFTPLTVTSSGKVGVGLTELRLIWPSRLATTSLLWKLAVAGLLGSAFAVVLNDSMVKFPSQFAALPLLVGSMTAIGSTRR